MVGRQHPADHKQAGLGMPVRAEYTVAKACTATGLVRLQLPACTCSTSPLPTADVSSRPPWPPLPPAPPVAPPRGGRPPWQKEQKEPWASPPLPPLPPLPPVAPGPCAEPPAQHVDARRGCQDAPFSACLATPDRLPRQAGLTVAAVTAAAALGVGAPSVAACGQAQRRAIGNQCRAGARMPCRTQGTVQQRYRCPTGAHTHPGHRCHLRSWKARRRKQRK